MPSFIVIDRDAALKVLDQFLAEWTGGGEERSRIAVEVEAKSKLLEQAPKRKGFLFNRRDTTPEERRTWMEEAWADKSWESMAMGWQFYASHKQGDRKDRANDLAKLALALKATPSGTSVHINADDWRWANKKF